MKYFKLFFASLLLIVMPAMAATNDIQFSENTSVSDVTLGSGTTTMTVFSSSTAENIDVTSGVFTVTNPGSAFRVGSSDAAARTIVVLNDNVMESCTVNTTPGTSYATLPIASATYTIRPLGSASCSSLCSTLGSALTYNAYPTCGAATCATGYTRTGNGSGSICSPTSSGGGGGNTTATTATTTTTVTATTTPPKVELPDVKTTIAADGTKIITTTNTKTVSGKVTEVTNLIEIAPSASSQVEQLLKVDTGKNTLVSTLQLVLPATFIDEFQKVSNTKIKVTITSKDASESQKTKTALSDNFILGYDIFSITISSSTNNLTSLPAPIKLYFDVYSLSQKASLKVYFYNTKTLKWDKASDGGKLIDGKLVVSVNHLTDFALMVETPTTVVTTETNTQKTSDQNLQSIIDESNLVFTSGNSLDTILAHNGAVKNTSLQANYMQKYTGKLAVASDKLLTNELYALNNFIVYGTRTTKILGAGERAGVVGSYKKAFGKLPKTSSEWKDCIAIGNGRWPSEKNSQAESNAKELFKKIYLRDANMINQNDNAAVTVIAYGLRPANRKTDSEASAVKSFRGIMKKAPTSALDWDMVRAIAYSGAKR